MTKKELETKMILADTILRINGVELRAKKLGNFHMAEQLNRNRLRAILKS